MGEVESVEPTPSTTNGDLGGDKNGRLLGVIVVHPTIKAGQATGR